MSEELTLAEKEAAAKEVNRILFVSMVFAIGIIAINLGFFGAIAMAWIIPIGNIIVLTPIRFGVMGFISTIFLVVLWAGYVVLTYEDLIRIRR
jgi:hypothetical protein